MTLAVNSTAGASYTFGLSDVDRMVQFTSATAVAVTVPLNSSVAFPVGSTITFAQMGAGQLIVAGASGVTVYSTPGLKTRTQYSAASLIKLDVNTWLLVGDLSI
jgi:hypothetical protein